MNIQNAWRFIVAAQDNPVLAAWASVCDGHCPALASDISPYDAWDAYQYLFNHGFVSSADFDNTDIKKQFFDNHPEPCEIRDVLDRAKIISPDFDPGERPNKMSDNPFFQKDTALARQGNGTSNHGLAERRQSSSLSEAFSPRREAIAQPREAVPNSMFENPGPRKAEALQCQDPMSALSRSSDAPRIFCMKCGNELNVSEAGMPPIDELPGDGDLGPLRLQMFTASCSNHERTIVYHTTASESPHPGEF